jgi:hypothetical protein
MVKYPEAARSQRSAVPVRTFVTLVVLLSLLLVGSASAIGPVGPVEITVHACTFSSDTESACHLVCSLAFSCHVDICTLDPLAPAYPIADQVVDCAYDIL